ncbi:MAG: polysaccharide biosynthesis C-terminal domain-containing protein, partial [Lachnospiraceae bacterium]|nr:polysaccharide biosynthesis C-terminal domain-containing protein [Lachnospiraceae bacterium]
DTIFVARFVDTNALSAINIVCPVINMIVGLGTMLATGGNAIIARKMGEGKAQEARKDFTLFICAGFIIGCLICLFGTIFINAIVNILGATNMLFPYAKTYLSILFLFTPASMLQVLFQNLIVTAGHPKLGLALAVGAGIANIIFDYLFIGCLHFGIAGSALGTGIGYLIPSVIGIAFFLKKDGTLYFEKPSHDLKMLLYSCLNGSSEMVSQLATAVTTFLFNAIMLKHLGENGVAAITIVIYTQFLLTSLYIGFSMGVAPVISYKYGNKDYTGLTKVNASCFCFVSVVSVTVFLLSMFCSENLIAVFSPKGSDVYNITQNGFPIFSFSFLFSGINIFISAAFTALSNGTVSAVISFFRTFGLITVCLLFLPEILGITGVWLAVPIAEMLTLLLAGAFFLKYRKKFHYL